MDPLSNIQTTTSAPPPYSTHAPPGNFISTISVGGRSSPPPARGHPTTWPEKGSAGTDDGSWSTSQATFAGTKNDSNMAVQAPVANSLAITSPPSPNPMYPPPNKPIPTVSVGGSYSPPSARGQPLPLPVWPERPDPAADVTGWRWIGIVIPAKETNPSQITGRGPLRAVGIATHPLCSCLSDPRHTQFPVPCSYYCCHAGGLLSLLASLCCCVCGFAAAIYSRE